MAALETDVALLLQSRAVPIVVNVYFTINRVGGASVLHRITG